MKNDYLQNLRGLSASRGKRGAESSREKIRKVMQSCGSKSGKTEEVIQKAVKVVSFQQKEVEPLTPPPVDLKMRKGVSFD